MTNQTLQEEYLRAQAEAAATPVVLPGLNMEIEAGRDSGGHDFHPVMAWIQWPDGVEVGVPAPQGGWIEPKEGWSYSPGDENKRRVHFVDVPSWQQWCSGVRVIPHGADTPFSPPPANPREKSEKRVTKLERELEEMKAMVASLKGDKSPKNPSAKTASTDDGLPTDTDSWKAFFKSTYPDVTIPPAARTPAWFQKKHTELSAAAQAS